MNKDSKYIIRIDDDYLVGFDGKINLKSGLNKIYDRMRCSNFGFDHLEVLRYE